MNNSKERKLGLILSYVAIIVNTLIQLFYTPFLIKMLGQSEYGLYSLMSTMISYLTILDLGFGNAIIVYTSKYHAQEKYEEESKLHGMFHIIFIIIGVIATLLCLVLFLNIESIFGAKLSIEELEKAKTMMLILAFNLFITFAFSIYSSIISAYEKFTFKKIVAILSSLMKPIIMIPLLFMGFKSITLIVVITIVNIAVCFSNYIFCKKKLNLKIKFSGFNKAIFKIIFGYSIYIFLGEIVDKVNWSVDQFLLGAISGTISVSIYSIAAQLNNMFVLFSSTMSGIFLPKISKMVAKNYDSNELSNEFIKIGRIQFYIVFFLCSSFILFGKQFIILWVGHNFELSYYVALILIIPLCVPLIQTLGLSIIQAMNKFKFRAIVTFIMAIFNVIISIFLTKAYGPVGSAIGTAIALIICNIFIMNYYYYKTIKLDILKFWKSIFSMLVMYIIPILMIATLDFFAKIEGIYEIILFGTLYIIIYFIISYFLVMNEYEKNICVSIYKRFFRRKNKGNS